MLEFALVEGFTPEVEFSEPVWLEALPARIYHTPIYGEVPVTKDVLERMVKNFKENVRGQEIAVNYDHGRDPAKGNKAAGWFRDFKIEPSADGKGESLHALVEFTEDAQKEIKAKEWKYFSMEWDDWQDNAGTKHQDVILGGGVTNVPIAKNTAPLPVNFSETLWNELTDEQKKEVRINVLKKEMSEEAANAVVLLNDSGFDVKNESKEWEHSEPGTGPAPVTKETGADDPAIAERWRRDPLPLDPNDPRAPSPNKGEGVLTDEELAKLRKALDLKDDADVELVITTAEKAFSESVKLRETVALVDEEKRFAEAYPRVWAEQQRLATESRENNATKFSESVSRIKRAEGEKMIGTDKGLSALALDKIAETHKKFAEGSANLTDFEEVVGIITNGGIVDFSEQGSGRETEVVTFSTATAEGIQGTRKLFAEKVQEIQTKDNLKYAEAVAEAAKQFPELAQAYRAAAPA